MRKVSSIQECQGCVGTAVFGMAGATVQVGIVLEQPPVEGGGDPQLNGHIGVTDHTPV